MTYRQARLLTLLVLLASSPATYAGQEAAAPAPITATVDQLSWVSGAWTGNVGERIVEQHWSVPRAGSIMAMYRSIQKDRPTLYELLAIEQNGDHVVLRIKHFAPGPGLVGREPQDQSVDHTLVKLADRHAIFLGGTAESPIQVTFDSPNPDTLNITVARLRDGKPVATEFKYRRMTAGAR